MNWDRTDEQTARILELSPEERLFALLSLRWEDADALDKVIAKARKWSAQKAAERAS